MTMDATAAESASPAVGTGKTPAFTFGREYGECGRQVNDFYNAFTGRNRSLDAYRWEFLQVPAGPCLMWTITETSTQRIVGHHGIIPTPLVKRGVEISGARTENTIVDPSVRTKVFYPGMEKKALAEARRAFGVIYTVHSTGPGKLRLRFGYKPVGRWTVYLPKVGPAYLRALLERGRKTLAPKLPAGLARAVANVIGRVLGLGPVFNRRSESLELVEISAVATLAEEYAEFWCKARQGYDLTIDRSHDFLRWRISDNPHVRFRTWTLRSRGQLRAVIIGHQHTLSGARALYIDDIIVSQYTDEAFDAVLPYLPQLEPITDAIVVMTLAVDTPLHRALRRRFPLQGFVLQRLGRRLFDEMLALDSDGIAGDQPWYVTPVFTEGLDTSR